jgi:hypothetical protein
MKINVLLQSVLSEIRPGTGRVIYRRAIKQPPRSPQLSLPKLGSRARIPLLAMEHRNFHGSKAAFHGLLYLLERASLDLSNAFSRDVKFTSQFFER